MKKARKGLMGVYLLKNTIKKELFVGGAPSLTSCLKHHFDSLNAGIHSNNKLQLSWASSGPTAFEFSIVELLSEKEQLLERTNHWRKELNADSAEEIDLRDRYTGYVSVGSDTKLELRALRLGTFDATVKELIDFYNHHRSDE